MADKYSLDYINKVIAQSQKNTSSTTPTKKKSNPKTVEVGHNGGTYTSNATGVEKTYKYSNSRPQSEAVKTRLSANQQPLKNISSAKPVVKSGVSADGNTLTTQSGKQIDISKAKNSNQKISHTNRSNDDVKVSRWLSDGYKMSDDEKNQAKTIYKNYQDKQQAQIKNKNYSSMTNPTQEDLNMIRLNNKIKGSFAQGLVSSVSSLANLGTKGLEKLSSGNEKAQKYLTQQSQGLNKSLSDARSQSTIPFVLGNMAGQAAQYATFNDLMAGTKVASTLGKAGQAVANKVPFLGDTAKAIVGTSIGNVLNGQLADTVLNTAPEIADNAMNGKYQNGNTGKIASDIAKNQLSNLAFNALFEVPGLVKGAKEASKAIPTLDAQGTSAPILTTDSTKNVIENNAQNEIKNADTQNLPSESVKPQITPNQTESNRMENISTANGTNNYAGSLSEPNNQQLAQDILNDVTGKTMAESKQKVPEITKNIGSDPTEEELWNTLQNASAAKKNADIPLDETKRYDNYVPQVGKKISKVRLNSLENSGIATDQELIHNYGKKFFEYVPETEKETMKIANDRVTQDADKWYKKYTSEEITKNLNNGEDTDTMMQLFTKYNNDARAAKESGDTVAANNLRSKALNVAVSMRKLATSAGQEIEAFKKYVHTSSGAIQKSYDIMLGNSDKFMKDNPKAAAGIDDLAKKLSDILKSKNAENVMSNGTDTEKNALRADLNESLDNMLKESNEQTRKALKGLSQDAMNDILSSHQENEIARTLDFWASNGSIGIKDDTMDKVVELFDEAEKYNFNSKERVQIEDHAYSLLANDLANGKSFKDKFDAWRYFSMLANPVTHIKNITGNILFGNTTVSTKNNIAALLESSADRVNRIFGGNGISRTKSILTPADSDLIKACENDAYENAYRELSGNKYYNVGSSIEKSIPTWSNQSAIGRLLNKATDLNTNLLNKEDENAVISKYRTSLAGYLKANGYTKDILTSTNDESKAILDDARAYAIQQAKEAAFHQDSEFSNELSGFTNRLRNSEKLSNRIVGTAADVVVPFKKTPINILKSSIAYSPAEILKVASDIPKLYKGTIKASDFIDDISKTATGSTGLLVGAILAHEGILSSGYTESDKAQKFDKTTGRGQTAIHIGNKSLSINELSPFASPMIYGAVVYETLANKNGSNSALDTIVNGLTATANSITDMTMLSGIADTLSSVRYADADSNIFKSIGMSVTGNLASQFIPTIGGRIEKSIDDTARSSYSDRTGVMKSIEQQGNYLMTKIPGLQSLGNNMSKSDNPTENYLGNSMKMQPSIDAWGREKKNVGGSTLGRFAYNLLMPLQYSQDTSDSTDNALRAIYKKTDDDSVFPYTSSSESSVKVGDKEVKMSPVQWTQYQKQKGKLSKELVSQFVSGQDYKNLKDADKLEIINNIYRYSRDYNQSDILGKEMSSTNQKLSDIYKAKGAKGITDYFTENAIIEGTGANANDKTREIYEKGGIKSLKEYNTQYNAIKDSGLTMNEKTQDIYKKSGINGLKEYAADKKHADNYNLTNNDNTKEIYDTYGNTGLSHYKSYQISVNGNRDGSSMTQKIDYLKKQSYSDQEKGLYLSQGSSSEVTKELAQAGYYEDIYNMYRIKSEADSNGNGSVTKGELKSYLDSTDYDEQWKSYYFGLLSNSKNPY